MAPTATKPPGGTSADQRRSPGGSLIPLKRTASQEALRLEQISDKADATAAEVSSMRQSLDKILGLLESGKAPKTPAVVEDPDRTASGENLAADNSARSAAVSSDAEEDADPPPKKKPTKWLPIPEEGFVLGSTAAGGIPSWQATLPRGKSSVFVEFRLVERATIEAALAFTLKPHELIKLHSDPEVVRKATQDGQQLESRNGVLYQTAKETTTKIFPNLRTLAQCFTTWAAIVAYTLPTVESVLYWNRRTGEYINTLWRWDTMYIWPAVLAYHTDRFKAAMREHEVNLSSLNLFDTDVELQNQHLFHPAARKQQTLLDRLGGAHADDPARNARRTADNPGGLTEAEKSERLNTVCRKYIKDRSSCSTPCRHWRSHPGADKAPLGATVRTLGD